MNLGIIRKTMREALPLLVIVTAAITLLEALFVVAIREFANDLAFLFLQKPIFQRFAKMLVGAELGGDLTAAVFVTIGYAHPLLFALTWTFLLVTCSRMLVGEIERGTADLLLTLPVSRASVYVSVSAVWLVAGVPISLTTLLGTRIGVAVFDLAEPLDYSRLAILTANLFAMYVAIGGAALFTSSLCSRRAPAIAFVLAALLASFLLNFLGQFWSVAERMGFLGILHYYRPLPVVRSGDWPIGDMAALLAGGAAFWGAGLWRFTRRDIPAV